MSWPLRIATLSKGVGVPAGYLAIIYLDDAGIYRRLLFQNDVGAARPLAYQGG